MKMRMRVKQKRRPALLIVVGTVNNRHGDVNDTVAVHSRHMLRSSAMRK